MQDKSNAALDIRIESPIFEGMMSALNIKLNRCVKEIYDEKFESGEITLKLKVGAEEVCQTYPAVTESGEMGTKAMYYRKPVFEHDVSLTLKKTEKASGWFKENRELVLEDGVFKAVRVERPQISIEDLQKEEKEHGNDSERG